MRLSLSRSTKISIEAVDIISFRSTYHNNMNYTIEIEQEDDGRIIAEVIELPGVLAYGKTKEEAIAKAQALALYVIADRLENGETSLELLNLSFVAA